MSQVAVMGLGRASEYAIYEPEHHSEAKAWSIEVVGYAEAKFHRFIPCFYNTERPDCIWSPTEPIGVGIHTVKNVGDAGGTINIKFEELDSAGNPLPGGVSCGPKSIYLEPGECAYLLYREETSFCHITKVSCSSSAGAVLLPRSPGTYYFGLKCWSDDEDEPSYPSPTAALAGAEVLPVAAEGEKLAIPVTVVSGLTLVGLGILQARSRRF